MKFLADHMLGKLARYLRFMGYDTYYPDGTASDAELLKLARSEDRIVLTRDKEFARISGGYLVKSDDYRVQLKEVVREFRLNAENILTRCSICNTGLVDVPAAQVKGRVPEYVYEHTERFYMCPTCKRIYWYGTHTRRIAEFIAHIIGEAYED